MQILPVKKIKSFILNSENFAFKSNLATLVTYITGIIKTVMNPGIEQNVAAAAAEISRK